ncbi:heme-degrading domain-containing protein (plasmid) [Photobacterium sp. GJ3]|uniref:heme-degrading domain-containing protein n=1 Tax=Photobacterium sp. GJ3 TaxID=2829502 RepID=UPI001B8CD9D9|nr:heme-degrading domain-containing protein [Photobacterium sp. GJ3]QUJ69406.1 heme-degrading domain-containing protein [Photobacterium sp. GJ3]
MNPDALLAQEQTLQLNHFNHETAWALGSLLKTLAESRQASVAIEVYGFGQVLFSYAMPETNSDHLDWIRRKRNSVLRYGKSSYYLGCYNAQKQRVFESQPHVNAMDYCAHGGAFPIRIKGSGLVGVVTVSGLPQADDHALVTAALKEIQWQQDQ